MKHLVYLLILLLLGCRSTLKVVSSVKDNSVMQTELSPAQIQAITDALSEFPNESEMSVALVTQNSTLFYGLKKQHDTIKAVDNSRSVFEIGSITKVFTTHLLLNAVADGVISHLDAPIQAYSPFPIKGDPPITFKQLANHTSGLPGSISMSVFSANRANPYQSWHEDKLKKYLEKEVELESTPGDQYTYSNVGMAVLANTLGHLRSSTYEAQLQEEIFEPLQMTHSTSQRRAIRNKLVPGYNWKGKATDNWDLAAFEGAGAVLSTTEDLSHYLNWSMEALESQLSEMSHASIQVDEHLAVALGWHVIKGYTSEPFLWHNGGTGGYKSSMGINLANHTGVVILTNIGATGNPKKGMIDQLCYALMQTMDD